MRTADFDYELPQTSIAQEPVEPRDSARLLVGPGVLAGVVGGAGRPDHRRVVELPDLLEPGDLVVLNTTRVIPARVYTQRSSGGAVEVFVLSPNDDGTWEALVRPSRKIKPGESFNNGVRAIAPLGDGRWTVQLPQPDGLEFLADHGTVPLPPYISVPLGDPERYQTVFADRPASVAAPTAGLHLTNGVLDSLADRGVGIAHVELEVGLGTFRPISTDEVEDHQIHHERYRVPEETLDACRNANRVVAIGTTVVRALESAAAGASEGSTGLYIHGNFPFQLVDVLMTNFHVPRSSLLVLVESFMGAGWRSLYEDALAEGYRFLSFGDAMLCAREDRTRRN